jgi:hypothetical protein
MASSARDLLAEREFEYDRRSDGVGAPPPLARIPLTRTGTASAVAQSGPEAARAREGKESATAMGWGDAVARQLHHHGFAIVELPDETAAIVARGVGGGEWWRIGTQGLGFRV